MIKLIKLIEQLLFGVCLGLLLSLHLHNLKIFPVTRGFDARAHIEYIELIRTQHRLPLANEGWELYQPPLYYWLASWLPDIKTVQYLGLAAWSLLVVMTYYFLKRFFSDQLARVGTLFMASLPVLNYLVPTISNELLAQVLIMITGMCFLMWRQKIESSWKITFILSVLAGLSVLTKATAWLMVMLMLSSWLIDSKLSLVSKMRILSFLVPIIGLVGGWFYLRNLIYFANPFIASADFIPLSSFAQPVIPRTTEFLFNITELGKLDLFHAGDRSLIAGTYYTFFYDGLNVLAPVQTTSKAGQILVMMSFPIVITSIYGMFQGWKNQDYSTKFLSSYGTLLLMAYLIYNFKIPLTSTVKGSFVLSLALPLTYFFVYGLRKLTPRSGVIGNLYLILFVLVELRDFWIRSSWVGSGY